MFQVCAPSCHDCSTLRAWWEEDEERRHRFFNSVMGSNALPPSRCVPDVANFMIRQHVEAPSMWTIFPLQVCDKTWLQHQLQHNVLLELKLVVAKKK